MAYEATQDQRYKIESADGINDNQYHGWSDIPDKVITEIIIQAQSSVNLNHRQNYRNMMEAEAASYGITISKKDHKIMMARFDREIG